jgi:outer membrane immunogenic protein
MKKLLLSTAILVMPAFSSAYAQSNNYDYESLSPLSGFYVGGYGGYGWNGMEAPGADFDDVNGAGYGVFVGYKADTLLDNTVNRMGLGLNGAIEVSYGWSSADDSVGGANIEKDNEFGINFRPGLSFISDTAPMGLNPYGIIGYRRTEFEGSGLTSRDESFDGFELGIGTELVAYDDIGIRLDYSHVWYGSENGFDPDENNRANNNF